MSSGMQGASAPRTTGGISGSNARKINPVYREMMKKRLQEKDPSLNITRKDISKYLQSNDISAAEYMDKLRKNPNIKNLNK